MRRGHPGIGGWRNDNQRHYRPRSGGSPHFRVYRNPGLLVTPRFPPPNVRPHRGPPTYGGPQNDIRADHNIYRHNVNYQRQDRSNQYSERTPHSMQRVRYNVNIEHNNHQNYNEQCHINSMGDIDDRQPIQQEVFRQQHWESSPIQNRHHSYNERGHKMIKPHDQSMGTSTSYTGHRPPASDHYGTNSGPDNSDSFSRSVDDTVNIVRERLLNRNDSQYNTEQLIEQNSDEISHKPSNSSETAHQEQPTKKRIQRPRSTKSNCDQIKNNIVHQLFKMDKGKIHKLMDNPNSSSKFEFAISSLISESQNSLNRHLRSVAEKSLCSTNSEFIQNNNDAIYEDTFMKQMQCILDPQDTVLLEDIKPIIMAELQKVLQLNEFDHRFEITDEQTYQQHETHNDEYNSFVDNINIYQDVDLREENFSGHNIDNAIEDNFEQKPLVDHNDGALFERRAKKTNIDEDRRNSMESRRQIRQSVDNKNNDQTQSTMPLFDTNTEQLSEDDDPFAELDRQYHVAVDHNLIEDDICDSQTPSFEKPILPDNQQENKINFPNDPQDIKQEIDSQLHILAKSPLKLFSPTNSDQHHIKQECHNSSDHIDASPKKYAPCHTDEKTNKAHQDDRSDCKLNEENQDSLNNVIKNITLYKERKRSIDQRPSHRKEKRKKSDSFSSETNKQILNKNIIINVNDCAKKSSEKCDNPKSIFNLYFSKNENKQKDTGKIGPVEKEYSDKYVKRKESPNKILKDKKRLNSNSSSHSTQYSPTDKIDAKTKLKSIDMFLEQPKKVNVPATKKAAIPPNIPLIKTPIEEKKKINNSKKGVKTLSVAIQVSRKLPSKETQTFESRCVTSRFCQTEMKKFTKSVQTNPVTLDPVTIVEASDPLERMKQIDMEIQQLLQEKFKLYNSLESKDSCSSSMPTLGMTVLNVKESEPTEDTLSGDAIADDFTNIPVEELEQIAFESVDVVSKTPKTEKRNRRQKVIEQERISSESPPNTKKSSRRVNTPNISLIEQIITDDRPLEDIISLDEFETPAKTRKKGKKALPKRKIVKKKKKSIPIDDLTCYTIKECYVMLNRVEINKYIEPTYERQKFEKPEQNEISIERKKDGTFEIQELQSEDTVVGETLVSDNTIQIDMLDVSEDIIIGESCEVKLADDKDVTERIEIPVSEEIILDNSQSSCDDVPAPNVGQTDSQCKLYDYSADENLQRDAVTVTGHADAVLAIEYMDNNFVAACLDGNVYYFSGEGHLISTLRGSNLAVTCLTIVKEKFGTTLYSGSLDSRIRYYDLETGLEKGPECNVLSPIQTMDRAWDTIFVGTRTGFVLQFECKNNMLIPVSTVKFSDQSILALRALKEGPRKVLLVAARSENVTIKDAQTGLLLRTLDGPKMTVYTLLYEDGKVFCGTSSHQIHVFDYSSGSHVGVHEGGKGAVCLRAAGGLVFAGCYDGCVYVYRDGETAPFAQLRGPSLMLLSLAVHGTKIIAGYKDRSLYIWKIPLNVFQEMIL